MKTWQLLLGSVLMWMAAIPALADTPVLGYIETPYPALQNSSVKIAGNTYGAGAVAYGPIGTPLVLSGSNFGSTGSVQFIGYASGAVVSTTSITPSLWTSNLLILTVPSGAKSGLVKIVTSDGTSNGLPFLITAGTYAASCPVLPSDNQFQIVTSSLSDGTVGQSYSATLQATNGTTPYTWSLISGTLPSGLSLSSSGVLSGTPIAATSSPSNLTIKAVDSTGLTAQAALTLAVDAQEVSEGTVYSYAATYDAVGNVASYDDSVMGAWGFQYDTLNRLAGSNATSGDFSGQSTCLQYDSFGNRLAQVISSAPFQSGSGGASSCQAQSTGWVNTSLSTFNANNRIVETNARGVIAAPDYDAAGNMRSDGVNSYLYDGEGRVCAVLSEPAAGLSSMTGYLYDANGNRVAKGTITSMSCDPTANGFVFTETYVLGISGEQLTTLDGSNNWQRTNVYTAGKLLATYDAMGLHFHLTDPLGTRRMQLAGNFADANGNSILGRPETHCQSLPYGDQLNCFSDPVPPSTADDATPLHFTGKERDIESGNDYFGARYYSSAMGRFMSPDDGSDQNPANPQSWNLYAYGLNNPIKNYDPTGHTCEAITQGNTSFAGGSTGTTPGNPGTIYSQSGQPGGGNSGCDSEAQKQNQPQHDANHTVPLVVRDVSGQAGNPAGHVTVQVGTGSEVGFGPAQPMTKKQIAENASVPGVVEPRAAGAKTLDAVTIYLTPAEARNAQANINARAANPGNYQVVGSSCVGFGETIVHSTGARAPSDTLPSALIQDIRSMQIHDNSNQAP